MTESVSTPEEKSQSEGLRAWLGAAAISLATAFAILAPFFWLGTASGHDIQFHISSWVDAAGQWKEGILFPHWTEWANYGFGEPRFIFYPPLSWMLGAALGTLLPWTWIPVAFILVVQTFAGISAFGLVRRFVSSYWAALLGVVAYVANPYALLVIYTRSDYAELLATSFYPLLFLTALRLSRLLESEIPWRKCLIQCAVLFASVWLSNAPAGVLASYSLALLFFFAVVARRAIQPGLRGAFALALGLGFAAFYWIPAAYEQRWVHISGALAQGLTPAENFLFAATPDAEHDAFNRIVSYIALLVIGVILATGAVLWRRTRSKELSGELRTTFRILAVLTVVISLMMVRVSALLWNYLPKLRFVQFPWRWLAVIAVIFALFFAWTSVRRLLVPAWIILFLLCSLTGAYLVRHTWWDAEDVNSVKDAVDNQTGFEGTDEYDPLGDDHTDIPQKQPEAKLVSQEEIDPAPKSEIHLSLWTADHRIVLVKTEKPAMVQLRLLHYPAWTILVNGKPTKTHRTVSYNAILVPVGAGESRIEATFTQTRDRTIGGWISAASIFGGLAIGWPLKRQRQSA